MKKILCLVIAALMLIGCFIPCGAQKYEMELNAKSVLLMEASSGTVLYESNADESLPPASVTKIMTLLLVFEALDGGKISWNDTVSVSETASSMGGSQVFLSPGEQMPITDMVKSVVVASANDAAVALAEHIAGSTEGFVSMMNDKAHTLGMNGTVFYNPTGLDDGSECNLTTARDIAIMSRELLLHEKILEYTTIWMDTIRDGKFGLTNTNRLIRFYNGANGLKTGSTSKAGFCISATALRDGMQLIAVVMGSPTRDIRNEVAKKLLDYGFANYARLYEEPKEIGEIKVIGGEKDKCSLITKGIDCIVDKADISNIMCETELPEYAEAPIEAGDKLGTVTYKCGDETVGTTDILAGESVERITYFKLFIRILERFFI